MTAVSPRIWNETDIPAVSAADLSAALSLWLARERQGIVLVGEAPVATLASIEAAVIAMFEHPADGLGVLVRMRCVIEALTTRRLRHLVRADNSALLEALVSAAAAMRLNAKWGLSPLRLVWAIAAVGVGAETRKAA